MTLSVCRPAAPKGKQNEFHPVGREKVNCRMAAREAGLGHDLGAPNLAPGRSVAFMETTGEGLTSSAPPPPGSGAKPSRRDVIANQIFHSMWTNLFAVAGTREHLWRG